MLRTTLHAAPHPPQAIYLATRPRALSSPTLISPSTGTGRFSDYFHYPDLKDTTNKPLTYTRSLHVRKLKSSARSAALNATPRLTFTPFINGSSTNSVRPKAPPGVESAGVVEPEVLASPVLDAAVTPAVPTLRLLAPFPMITMDQSSERAVQEPVAFDVEITGDGFKLAVPLPGYSAVEITVAMKQNRDLHVIADRWDLQANCRHEWAIQFHHPIMRNTIRAKLENDVFTILTRVP